MSRAEVLRYREVEAYGKDGGEMELGSESCGVGGAGLTYLASRADRLRETAMRCPPALTLAQLITART